MIRFSTLLLALILLISKPLYAQVLTEWVESRAPEELDKIALGYPVPRPVDTPLPSIPAHIAARDFHAVDVWRRDQYAQAG